MEAFDRQLNSQRRRCSTVPQVLPGLPPLLHNPYSSSFSSSPLFLSISMPPPPLPPPPSSSPLLYLLPLILLLLIVLHLRMVFQFNFLSHMYGCSYECNMMFLCVNLPQQLIVMHNASRAQWSPGSWPIIEFARRTISGRQIVWDFALCYNYAC